MPINYHYVRESSYNNNGKFGSDIIVYYFYKDEELIGSVVHDFYENRSVIKYDNDRLILNRKWFVSEIKSKNTGKVVATINCTLDKFIIKESDEKFVVSISYAHLNNNFWKYKLFGEHTEAIVEVKKEVLPNVGIRLIPFQGKIFFKGEVNFLSVLMSFNILEQMIYLEATRSND